MNNLEKYLDQVIEQKPAVYEPAPAPKEQAEPNVMKSLQRRWRLIVLVFVVLCAAGLPAVWLLVKPRSVVQGAIRVLLAVRQTLSGEMDRGEFINYESRVNTLAGDMKSGPVLDDVADDLASKSPSLLNELSSDPMARLKRKLGISLPTKDTREFLRQAIADGTITIGLQPKTEYLTVTMRSRNETEAVLIVNSFLTKFYNRHGNLEKTDTGKVLERLKKEEDELNARIKKQQDEIYQQTLQYGTTALDSLQKMEMQRQATWWGQLADLETQRIGIDATIAVLGQTTDSNAPPEQLMSARKAFVSADPTVQEMTKTVIVMQRDLMVAKQTLTPGNPELVRKQQLLDVFTKSLEDKQKELEKTYDEQMADTVRVANQQHLRTAQAAAVQIDTHIQKLKDALSQQDTTTRKIGNDSVNLQNTQFNMALDQKILEEITRRIRTIEMELDQSARFTIVPANLASIEDKRVKYTAMVVFLALGCGFGLAVLRDKLDKTLQTPDDLSRYVNLPIIGTTTSSRTVKPAVFAEHLAGDYQTIRTNLSLTSGGMPKKLAVCSAGMREGKTTFAVNLATSLAKAGKKVLLVDGDLRKPDVGYMLSISNGTAGVQEVLLGGNPEDAIRIVPSSGLHVLVANPRNVSDVYELLTSTTAAEQIEKLGRRYDHVIVDTPPTLAFPDALVWAKLTDGVILVSFAGQTTAPELKEAKARFARIRARVLGTILSNVPADVGLYRSSYGYGYRSSGTPRRYRHRVTRKLLLPTHAQDAGLDGKGQIGTGDKQS